MLGSIVVGPPFDPTGQNNVNSNRKNRVRCLRWDRTELMDLLESDKGLRNALKVSMSKSCSHHGMIEGADHQG